MFKVIGDIIEYDGRPVAVIRQDVLATTRQKVVDAIETYNKDYYSDIETLRAEMDDLRKELTNMRAMLGVKS